MCRNIKKLRLQDPPISEEDVRQSAYHLVSKISGYRKPSKVNQKSFDKAVEEITAQSIRLLEALTYRGEQQCVVTSKN